MDDEPDNPTLVFLRRLDTKMDRVIEDVADVKQRLTTLEIQVGQMVATEASHYAQTMLRIDRVEVRLDRIERRQDLMSIP
jgi:hypothetical protein